MYDAIFRPNKTSPASSAAAAIDSPLERTPAEAPFLSGERLTLDDAVWIYTVGGAIAAGDELKLGSILPGYLADLTVLEVEGGTEKLLEDPRWVGGKDRPEGRVGWVTSACLANDGLFYFFHRMSFGLRRCCLCLRCLKDDLPCSVVHVDIIFFMYTYNLVSVANTLIGSSMLYSQCMQYTDTTPNHNLTVQRQFGKRPCLISICHLYTFTPILLRGGGGVGGGRLSEMTILMRLACILA